MKNAKYARGAALAAAASILATPHAAAQDAAAAPAAASAPAPSWTASTNVNIVSDYRFRGVDQTWGHPAVQGGADLTWASGFYLGTWLSNVSGNEYPGGSLEVDYYGGYNGRFNDDFGFTIGGYGYWYPGANFDKSACGSAAYPTTPCTLPSQSLDTFEINAGLSWKWIAYKLSYSTGDYFGANASTGYSASTAGTMYHDLTVTVPLPYDLSLAGHIGRTDYKGHYGTTAPDFTDYRVALSKSFEGGWTVAGIVAGADNDAFWRPPVGGLSFANGDTRELNQPAFIVQAGRTF